MALKFALRFSPLCVIVWLAMSSVSHAQAIINLTPAPTPAGPHKFNGGADINVAGATNPGAASYRITMSWNNNLATYYMLPNNQFTTVNQYAGGSTIQAPLYNFLEPTQVHTITVESYGPNGGNAKDSKTIKFKINPPG